MACYCVGVCRNINIIHESLRKPPAGEVQVTDDTRHDPNRRVGPEARQSYRRKIESGFLDRYLSRPNILDIGYKGGDPESLPIVPQAVGVDRDFPNYDGRVLPFPDESQDAVFSSHCLEHIEHYRSVLAEWYRVLCIGGYLIVAVPHQWLYERKALLPSLHNRGHRRYYTPASLMREVEESLPVGGYRVRHLRDNDDNFDYTVPPHLKARGCREIELVVERIKLPAYVSSLMVPTRAIIIIETYVSLLQRTLDETSQLAVDDAMFTAIGKALPIPPYAILKGRFPSVPEEILRRQLRPMIDASIVDGDWYISSNVDLLARVRTGEDLDPCEHYRVQGYFQHRSPRAKDPIYSP
jgi:SAM-dependent methyltransferase